MQDLQLLQDSQQIILHGVEDKMYKCTNCSWEGNDLKSAFCPICGDNIEQLSIKVEEEPKPIKKTTKKKRSSKKKK